MTRHRVSVSTDQMINQYQDFSCPFCTHYPLAAIPHYSSVTAYTHKQNQLFIDMIWYNTLIFIVNFGYSSVFLVGVLMLMFYLEEIYISRSIKKSGTFHVCFF